MVETLRRILSAILLLALAAGLPPATAQAGISPMQPRQISDHNVFALSTYGNSLFYHDPQTRELVVHDLSTGSARTAGQAAGVGGLSFSNRHAAYVTMPDKESPARLVLMDLATARTTDIATANYFGGPIVTETHVIWGQASAIGTMFTLYAQDLATGARRELSRAALWGSDSLRPLLSDGRYVVWQENYAVQAVDMQKGGRISYPINRLRAVYAVDSGRVLLGYQASLGCSASEREAIAIWDMAEGTVRDYDSRTCGQGQSKPALRGDVLAVAQVDGQHAIFLTELSTSRRLRLYAADSYPKGNLYVADNTLLYVSQRADGNRLIAIPFVALPDRVLLPRPVTDSPTQVFTDLARSHWAYGQIELAVIGEHMRGYPDGTFRPDAQISRAEFLTVLMRAYPKTGTPGAPFADVPSWHWASKTILLARGLGLVTGQENRFNPDSPITRAEMAVMLQRFLALPEPTGTRPGFPDITATWSWAAPSVQILSRAGILTGFPDGTFGPAKTATRAQVAAILARLYK